MREPLIECPGCGTDLQAYQEEFGKVWCPECNEYKR
jgi:uncharacterized Zn finger protein (UPF0148 family)